MGRSTRRGAAGGDQPSANKQRQGQQQGIAAALAAQGARAAAAAAAADLRLVIPADQELLSERSMEDLSRHAETYLKMWGDKSYERFSGQRQAAASAAAASHHDEGDLDSDGLRYTEAFRHALAQAFKLEAAVAPQHLELLALMLRNDVLHSHMDVSHQAYCLLRAHLERFPYASVARFEEGEFAGRPYLLLNERAAWHPLAASNFKGLTRQYIMHEAIKDGGHNYRLDHGSKKLDGAALTASRKKEGLLRSALGLLHVLFDRAVDSVDNDYNGDLLLLRYLLVLVLQDLRARLQVFAGWAGLEDEAVLRRRAGVLQNSLLWRIWTEEDVQLQHNVLALVMKLIVGVASEEDLQEVDEEHHKINKDIEAAAPCICTPRELAALAACFLNGLLDLFGAVETAGGFVSTSNNRMHRKNQRLRLDKSMKELFWKGDQAVCKSDEACRTLLSALAPAHRLRLLSLVAMEQVSKAYSGPEELKRRPAVARAKALTALVTDADSGEFGGAFPADPVVALQCLNDDPSRSYKVCSGVAGLRPMDNLVVLAGGIALAAHSLVAAGCEVPGGDSSGSGSGSKEGSPSSSAGGDGGGTAGGAGSGTAASGRQQLVAQLRECLGWLVSRHKEAIAAGKAPELSQTSLFELIHAQAAVALL